MIKEKKKDTIRDKAWFLFLTCELNLKPLMRATLDSVNSQEPIVPELGGRISGRRLDKAVSCGAHMMGAFPTTPLHHQMGIEAQP